MKKILVVFGTRPEAIKLVPVIKILKRDKTFKTYVCSTGQHKEMVKQVLDIFDLKSDYNMNIMKKNQDLFEISSNSISKFKEIFSLVKPDLLIVQGDTTTAFTASLAAFYTKIKIAHVEAGLRSFNKFHPYPEEVNRKIISLLADYHFAPTKLASNNLIKEGVRKDRVYITGNTVIDSLVDAKEKIKTKKAIRKIEGSLSKYLPDELFNKKFILVTLHRREKFGPKLKTMLLTIKSISEKYDYNFVYPVHLNPNVQKPVYKILGGVKNIFLLPPLDYLSFIYLMSNCYFILTDSGGIQEESYIFKKPLIVMREVTEREEAIKAGYAFLTGSNPQKIKNIFAELDKGMKNNYNYFKGKNPFGEGYSSQKIVDILKRELQKY